MSATTALDLHTFADAVHAACRRVPPAGRFGGDRIFIHACWAIGAFTTNYDLSLAEFKALLCECNRLRLLDLTRADLVEAMSRWDVERSTATHLGATYNFVTI